MVRIAHTTKRRDDSGSSKRRFTTIVKEIVDFCARNGIYCQAGERRQLSGVLCRRNVTAVDAVRHNLLFDDFYPCALGAADIVDIEACRRRVISTSRARLGGSRP